jgi:hypothetical protein
MRPRIQATISQFSYDLLHEEQDRLNGLQLSRVVDRIIIEWVGYKKKEKGHLKENKKLREKVNDLEVKITLLHTRLDDFTKPDYVENDGKIEVKALFEKVGNK